MKLYHLIPLYLFASQVFANSPNIVSVAVDNPNFSTLVEALKAADLVETVKNGTFTVLAPSNDSFDKLPEGVLEDLLKPENKAQLAEFLTYHVIPGRVTLDQLIAGKQFETVQGQAVTVAFRDGRIRLNDTSVIQSADIVCENGVIHVIDSVLLPPASGPKSIIETAAAAGTFSTLIAAAQASGLIDALNEGEYTVFAPTDEAFAALPKQTVDTLFSTPDGRVQLALILKNHVAEGTLTDGDALNAKEIKTIGGQTLGVTFTNGELRIEDAKILNTNIKASNGLIHSIDRVLLPATKNMKQKATTPMINKALTRIQETIEQGVPIFNDGDPKGCSDLYRATAIDLTELYGLPSPMVKGLKATVKNAENEPSPRSQAWILRAGLDKTYAALQRMEQDACAPACTMTPAKGERSSGQKVPADTTVLMDFTEDNPGRSWKTVNDNVMGGRSKGGPSFVDGDLVFSGSTNTDGGGFSSIRSSTSNWMISEDADGIVARIKGDGRTYQFDLRKKGVSRWTAYRAEFTTQKSWSWREIRIPFSAFKPTQMGRPVKGKAIDGAAVDAIGLFIYDKKDGPFKLQVDWIGSYQDES